MQEQRVCKINCTGGTCDGQIWSKPPLCPSLTPVTKAIDFSWLPWLPLALPVSPELFTLLSSFVPAFRAQLAPKKAATLNNSVTSLSSGVSGASSLKQVEVSLKLCCLCVLHLAALEVRYMKGQLCSAYFPGGVSWKLAMDPSALT